MKVYSWKTLLAVLFAALVLVDKLCHFGGFADLIWVACLVYTLVQGLVVTFSKEACEEDRLRGERSRRAYQKLYGRFAPVAPWLPLLLLLAVALVLWLAPGQKLLLAGLAFAALAAAILMDRAFRRELRALEEQEKAGQVPGSPAAPPEE